MKITVDIPDSELKEVCSVTGENKKGPAIRKLLAEALQLKRREKLVQKFLSGEWGVELKGLEEGRAVDQQIASRDEARWRRQCPP